MADTTGPQALADYVKVAPVTDYVRQCWDEAAALVGRHIGDADVPATIRTRATIEVGAELYNRQNAPSGVLNQATEFGGTPTRVARDPMVAAYPLLRPWVGQGLA